MKFGAVAPNEAIGATATLWLIVGWLADAKLVAHHSTSGTPLVALLGIGLNVIGVVALGVAAIIGWFLFPAGDLLAD